MSDLDAIFVNDERKQITIPYEGKEFVITVKPISWAKKNKILSDCFNFNTDGTMHFSTDKYMKTMLSEMIIEAPWGKTNEVFLNRIKPDFGAKLEALVPKAFDQETAPDFFVKELDKSLEG